MFQSKEQDKAPEKQLNETEMSNLPDRVKNNGHKDVHWTWEKSVWEQRERPKNDRKYQTEVITELKSTLEGFNRTVDKIEKQISELREKAMENKQTKQQNEKES